MQKQHCVHMILGLAVGLVSAMPSYGAQQPGWFFGISLARSEPQLELPTIRFANRNDNGYKLVAGYRFGPYWKAELSYLDIGKSLLNPNPIALVGSSDIRGNGLQVVGTANMPLTEKIGVFGKLGAFHSNLEIGCMTNTLTCSVVDRGTDLSYGVGLRYDFTKTVGVQGEWERFRRFGNRDTMGDADRDFFSVGLGFKF